MLSARIAFFMVHLSELQGQGAADHMNFTVSFDGFFVAAEIHNGEIALLQLLVLVADIQTDRMRQPAGALVLGADADTGNDLVGIQVIYLRITRGFERGFLPGDTPRRAKLSDNGTHHPAAVRGYATRCDCLPQRLPDP